MVNNLLVVSATMIGVFVIAALLSEDVDDDDDMHGGMMIPAYQGAK